MVSSHAGTRLPIAVMTTVGRSPASWSIIRLHKKTEAPNTVPLQEFVSSITSSYDGIIRIRYKGRS